MFSDSNTMKGGTGLRKTTFIIIAAVAIMLMSAFTVMSDDADAADSYTVNVLIEENGKVTKLTGTGSTFKDVIKNAVTSSGHTIDMKAIAVSSFDGKTAPDGKAWTVQQWLPPREWQIVNFKDADKTIANGTSYFIYLADVTTEELKKTYSSPSYEPVSTGYFFIQMKEDVNANSYVTSVLTEEQRRTGFWIWGEGSSMAYAFKDACSRFGIELDMSDGVKGSVVDPDYIGWLNSLMGLKDELKNGDIMTGNWLYWSQFYWDGNAGKWVYSQTSGHYDPAVNPYYALVRQITTKDNVSADIDQSPSDVPVSEMKNGCKVTFVDGNGNETVRNVPYFGSADAPSTASRKPTSYASYVFKGWEGNYEHVTGDVTVRAVFDEIRNTKVTGVTITDSIGSLTVGESFVFKASVSPSGATVKDVKWSVSDSSIASVDSEGKVTAKKTGTVRVTATSSDGGYTDTKTLVITSSADSVWSVSIDGGDVWLEVSKTGKLTATVEPSEAKDKSVTWKSNNESVAKIDSEGNIAAVSEGKAVVTVTTNDGGFTASVNVSVMKSSDNVWTVGIDGGDREIKVSENIKLNATVLPENAKNRNVKWSVSDDSVITIDQDGSIIGKKLGTATVTVKTEDGGIEDTITVKVVPQPGQASYVTIRSADFIIEAGKTTELTADVDPDALKKDVAWYSSDSTVLSVDEKTGKVTAVKPGSVKITVITLDSGAEGYCYVGVYAKDDVSHIKESTVESNNGKAEAGITSELKEVLAENNSGYTVTTDRLGSVTLDADILKSNKGEMVLSVSSVEKSELRDVQKKIVGNNQVYSYQINGSDVSDLGGKATVSIPYILKTGESAKDVRVYCIDYKGNLEPFGCTYDSKTSTAVFETTHFSLYFATTENLLPSDDNQSSDSTVFIAIGAVIAIAAIGAVVFVIRRKA